MISYRARLDVPAVLVWFVSGLLAAHRHKIGTRNNTRKLGCYRQARAALERALAAGTPYVILDGTLIGGDRCREKTIGSRHGKEVDAWYSGKSKAFGGNIQGVFYPDGRPMWVSGGLPGRVNDLAAAKELVFAVLRCLGERGFALLKQRRQTLQHITASPGKIGDIARAALVPTLFEHKMLT